jgi:hypothetical protein
MRKTSRKLLLIPVLLVALLAGIFAGAGAVYADNASDMLNSVRTNGYYISDAAAKQVGDVNAARKTLSDEAKKLKDRGRSTVLALIDPNTLPTSCNGTANSSCAETVLEQLNSYETVFLIDVVNKRSGYVSKEKGINIQQLLPSGGFNYSNPVQGLTELAGKHADEVQKKISSAANQGQQISSQQKQDALVPVLIVSAVVLVLVMGAFFFLVSTTKSIWRKKVENLESSTSEVSDMVYRLSTDVEFLPDGMRDEAKATFSQGAMQVSDANEAARQIKSASTVTLLFKWGQFNNKYQDALSKMDSIRSTLQRVDATVKREL